MEQKFEELKKENEEQAAEYFEFIKSSVNDGSYFKDAQEWYFFRYVSPFCQRTMLILASILAAIVLFCLVEMISQAFPLVQKVPVIIRAKDQSRYFPNLIALKPHQNENSYDPEVRNVEEATAKYLLSKYIQTREGFDYSSAEVEDVNNKFSRIKNTSSANEYREFQIFMSKDNPLSPINKFGDNIAKTVNIDSVKFVRRQPTDFSTKAKDFISSKIPTEAEVRFTTTTKSVTLEENPVPEVKESYLAKVSFTFAGIDKSEKNGPINFSVNSYKLYKVQK